MNTEILNTSEQEFKGKMMSFSMNATSSFVPQFVEGNNSSTPYVFYGKDNKFCYSLINLIKDTAIHSAIFKSVVQQVKGSGIRIKENVIDSKLQQYIDNCNSKGENLYSVIEKLVYDYVLFGGFATCNIWTKGKQGFEIYHTDFSTLRSGKADVSGTINDYYYSSDWTKGNQTNFEKYPAFNIEKRNGTQINYYIPYNAGLKYYPLPVYQGVIGWAAMDAAICEFHTANISNAFFPSFFLNYTNGIPSPERADELYTDLLEQFEGGSKAGKVIINFSQSKDTSPEITVLNNNDNDTKFTELSKLIQTELVAGWRVPSPELVGIKIQGELSSTDLIQAQELFWNLTIQPMMVAVEKEINRLLRIMNFQNEIEIIPVQPISFSLSESAMLQTLTVNELREMAGKKPLPNGDYIPQGKNISPASNTPTQSVQEPQKDNTNESDTIS